MARCIDQRGTRRVTRSLAGMLTAALLLSGLAACSSGSDDSKSDAGTGGRGGSGGAGGSGGTSDGGTSMGGILTAGASSGDAGTGGAMASTGGAMASTGGAMASTGGAMASTGGAMSTGGNAGGPGTQPVGAICSFDTQCSQEEGEVVCCENTCTLGEACPTGPLYLPCESTPDCEAYGGGRLCCEVNAGGEVTRFCTKRSGCSGRVLP